MYARLIQEDREPFVAPDGRTVMMKRTFIVSHERPVVGRHGHFDPHENTVLWEDHQEQPCLLFGGGHQALDRAREKSALLPSGPEREKAHHGPVTLLCRPKCSFKPPSVRKRRGFANRVLSVGGAGCRSH